MSMTFAPPLSNPGTTANVSLPFFAVNTTSLCAAISSGVALTVT